MRCWEQNSTARSNYQIQDSLPTATGKAFNMAQNLEYFNVRSHGTVFFLVRHSHVRWRENLVHEGLGLVRERRTSEYRTTANKIVAYLLDPFAVRQSVLRFTLVYVASLRLRSEKKQILTTHNLSKTSVTSTVTGCNIPPGTLVQYFEVYIYICKTYFRCLTRDTPSEIETHQYATSDQRSPAVKGVCGQVTPAKEG